MIPYPMLTDILFYILYIYIYISVHQYSTDARRAQASGFNVPLGWDIQGLLIPGRI